MTNILWKSFNLCFSNFKCFTSLAFSQPPAAIDELDHNHRFSSAGTAAASGGNNPSIFKNFNSLYDAKSLTFPSTTTSTTTAAATDDLFSSTSGEDFGDDFLPDFTSAFASNRFFLSSPGRSNSIVPRPPPPPEEEEEEEEESSSAMVGGGVAVLTYSPDPYADFRGSIVEMIEACNKADWEFLNELLFCYLSLNPKNAHKFIVEAFVDVIMSMVLLPAAFSGGAADGGCCNNHQLRCSAT